MTTDRLPDPVIETVERLARRERRAPTAETRREHQAAIERRLDPYEYSWRIRADEDGETLVLYPAEWVDDVVQFDRIEDTSRAVERPLSPREGDDWDSVDAANRQIVEAVRRRHGDKHAENASAFATFLGNHYLYTMDTATEEIVAKFLEEYYPRNVWPSEDERACVEESIEIAIGVGKEEGLGTLSSRIDRISSARSSFVTTRDIVHRTPSRTAS
ncbi:MAG: rnhA operon protein [Natrialbaceae archaeon]|nr:rnhA operon protein [Natrialbaceae archaeon]